MTIGLYSMTIGLYSVALMGCSSQLNVAGRQGAGTSSPEDSGDGSTEDEFSIAILPDTQYYSEESQGGSIDYFKAQTSWIVKNREKEHIAYVIQEGDIVDKGDLYPKQWENAWAAMSTLETPYSGHPYGIPYGLAVGNHDQSPSQFAVTGKTMYYNKYFGIAHFAGRPYYGGHYGNDNDSHYDLLTAGGRNFIIIFMEFDAFDENQDNLNNWACGILDKYADRKAIIVSHYLIGNNKVAGTNNGGAATFGKQGQRMFDRLKTRPNIFMMVCGHVGDNGEGYRKDTYAGNTIQTFLADYQSRPHGGNGLMRLMTFSKKNDLIRVRTLSPYLGIEEEDADSKFIKPWLHQSGASRIYDFDNDGKSELALFRDGRWKIKGVAGAAAGNVHGAADSAGKPKPMSAEPLFGKVGDIPVPADFDGTGRAELAVYSPDAAVFHILGTSDKQGSGMQGSGGQEQRDIPWGEPGDIPVPADYDGDGLAEVAVWRPSNSTWYIKGREPFRHGWKDAIPVPADYDGDGRVEPAVFRKQNNTWYIADLGNVPFGRTGDIPVPGDYNGDGKAEMAIYRPSTGSWLFYGLTDSIRLGEAGDIPVPGDYYGEGRLRAAVYRPSTNTLLIDKGGTILLEGAAEELVNFPYYVRRQWR